MYNREDFIRVHTAASKLGTFHRADLIDDLSSMKRAIVIYRLDQLLEKGYVRIIGRVDRKYVYKCERPITDLETMEHTAISSLNDVGGEVFEPSVVTNNGQPMCVVVPINTWLELIKKQQ
jgi:hypothetical protein